MDFLHAEHEEPARLDLKDGKYISAKDKHVIVIGGGDTGTDCIGTSHRHGCKSLDQLRDPAAAAGGARAGQSLAAVAEDLPVDYGHEEAAGASAPTRATTRSSRRIRRGRDRPVARRPHDARGVGKDANGQPADGRDRRQRRTSRRRDLVLLAMGFRGRGTPSTRSASSWILAQLQGASTASSPPASRACSPRRLPSRSVAGRLGDQRGARAARASATVSDGRDAFCARLKISLGGTPAKFPESACSRSRESKEGKDVRSQGS